MERLFGFDLAHYEGNFGVSNIIHNPLTLTDDNKSDLKGLLATIPGFTEHMDELKEQAKHIDLKTELGHIVRRGFIKQMVVQLYNTSPLLTQMMKRCKTP